MTVTSLTLIGKSCSFQAGKSKMREPKCAYLPSYWHTSDVFGFLDGPKIADKGSMLNRYFVTYRALKFFETEVCDLVQIFI